MEIIAKDQARSSIVDAADIRLAELHNVIGIQESSRVRDLTSDNSTPDLVCKCCSMSAVENI